MENAVDALYMAFAVIAFVIALSLSIFAFTNVTTASQRIIDNRDKTSMYTYIDTDELSENGNRIVTGEDVIPTLYRAYYENYMIRFEGLNNLGINEGLYSIKVEEKDESGNTITEFKPTNIIDLEGQKIGNHNDADKLINALLQGKLYELFEENSTSFSSFQGLQKVELYGKIKESKFEESIGLYYMEDREYGTTTANNEGLDDVNKTKKRIITYKYLGPNT